MKVTTVTTWRQRRRYIAFRREMFRRDRLYVDNDHLLIRELFAKRTCFLKDKECTFLYVEDGDRILCQALVVYTDRLPEAIQLCLFVAREGCEDAVELLVETARRIGVEHGCSRMVVGLNGHVNYGLGLQCSHHHLRNSFSSAADPEYHSEYFRGLGFEARFLNTYQLHSFEDKLRRYAPLIRRIEQTYTFRYFDKKRFDQDAKLYTDLNDICFAKHRYYYPRTYEEDREMLRELFLFMKEDSLIFAFDGEKPIGFIMWYPDYNELSKGGAAFGAAEFLRYHLLRPSFRRAKVMEFGIIEEYRKIGLPIALLHQVLCCVQRYGIHAALTSWVLAENEDSNSVCRAVCDEEYIKYVVYEKEIGS